MNNLYYIYLNISHPVLINKPDNFILYSLIALGAVLFVALVLAFILSHHDFSKKQEQEQLNILNYNIRIYLFNYAKKTYSCFDSLNLRNRKEFSEHGFLSQFSTADKYAVSDWLKDNTLGPKPTRPFLQVGIKVGKKTIMSILEITSVDHTNFIIHFTSKLLPDMSSEGSQLLIGNKGMANQLIKVPRAKRKFIIKDENEAEKFLQGAEQNRVPAVFYLSLYKETPNGKETDLSKVSRKLAVFAILAFLNSKRKLYRVNDTDVVIIDIQAISKPHMLSIATSMDIALQKYLNVREYSQDLTVSIGLAYGTFGKDIDLAISQSCSIANAIKEKNIGYENNRLGSTRILFYETDFFERITEEKKDLADIELVIKNATFRLFFTPTLDIKSGKSPFFFLSIRPYGTLMKNFDDLVRFSYRIPKGPLSLYEAVISKTSHALLRHPDTRLVISLPVDTIPIFIKAVKAIGDPDVFWTVSLTEADLFAHLNDQRKMRSLLNECSSNDISLAIELVNSSSSLPKSVLSFASYFIVGPNITSRITDNASVKSDLRLIEANYSIYEAPLVYKGLVNYEGIELGALFGGTIFQSDSLALPSSIPQRIEDDKVHYIMDDIQTLLPSKKKQRKAGEVKIDD